MPTEKVEATVSAKVHDEVVAELETTKKALAEAQKSNADLIEAFNRLLKEYNDMHVALLFKK